MRALEPGDPDAAGPYRLLARIATGGTATVYLGRSAGGRAAAVKVLHPAGERGRFSHEIAVTRAAAGGYSPALLDADPDADAPWLALEYLAGISLRDAVRLAGPLPSEVVAALAVGIAEAVRAVHAAGILHLDINPANVLLTADGPRLIDFGLAVFRDQAGTDVAGAPGFIAPELLTGGPPKPASDVYALGATLVYASTGSPPDGVPGDDLLSRCLNPDPARRPGLTELLVPATMPPLPPAITDAIQERVDPQPPPRPAAGAAAPAPSPARITDRRRRVLIAAALASAVAAAGIGWALHTPDQQQPRSAASSAPSPSPTPSPSKPAATSRTFTFYCTGNATLARLIFSVNGKSTTVDNPKLPWRKDVKIDNNPNAWTLRHSQPFGTLSCQMTIDGKHVYAGAVSGTAGPDDVPTAPTHSYSGTD